MNTAIPGGEPAAIIDTFRGPHFFLSNFFPHLMILPDADVLAFAAGRHAPTVEHGFQAAKALNAIDAERTLRAPSPGAAKRQGRDIRCRSDWLAVRIRVMELLLRTKFSDPELRERLRATAPAALVEGNTWGDAFWGVCNGRGENLLGKLLMKVRDELAAKGA